jgi:hypothetical protein
MSLTSQRLEVVQVISRLCRLEVVHAISTDSRETVHSQFSNLQRIVGKPAKG